jgi:hypothetical protein
MSFTKFVWLLDSRSLYFSRVDHLNDRFEGSLTKVNVLRRQAGQANPLAPGKGPLTHQLAQNRDQLPKLTYVNCWTLGGYESVGMWRSYVGDGDGVALESTFTRLTDSLANEPLSIRAGKVKYIDFEVDFVPEENLYYAFAYKRRNFEYEKEVRAAIYQFGDGRTEVTPGPLALHVPSDLDVLIERVRVSPASGPWFKDLVVSVLARYGVDKEVRHSELGGEPTY